MVDQTQPLPASPTGDGSWLDVLADEGWRLRAPKEAHSERVSVVIPSYNRSADVIRAVASVVAQTHPAHEVIVVDDCSTDDSVDRLRREFGGRTGFHILSTGRRAGACAARNVGIAASEGCWVAFLDSDDLWDPDKLECQLAALRGADAVAAFTGSRAERNGKIIYERRPVAYPKHRNLVFGNSLGTTSTAMVSRRTLLQVGGFDPAFPSCQDWDLYFRVMSKGDAVAVPEPKVTYNENDHDRISTSYEKVKAGHDLMFQRIIGIVNPPTAAAATARYEITMAEIAARFGMPVQAILQGAKVVVRRPRAGVARSYLSLVGWQVRIAVGRLRRSLSGLLVKHDCDHVVAERAH